MKRFAASILLAIALGGTGGVLAQTTLDQARQEGAAMGKAMRADESLGPTDDKVAQLPGYAGTDLPE